MTAPGYGIFFFGFRTRVLGVCKCEGIVHSRKKSLCQPSSGAKEQLQETVGEGGGGGGMV